MSRILSSISRLPALALMAGTAIASPLLAQHATRTPLPSIPQVAQTAGQFGTLLAAVDAAGLTRTLLGNGPFTLFAPTDDAFALLPANTVRDLLKPENRDQLRTILTYHVLAGRVSAAQARNLQSAATVAGATLRISQRNDELRINDATVRIADIPASNGVVHVINRVLLPPSTDAEAGNSTVALIDYAIDRGAPLYNDGQSEAAVAIYEVAVTALLALEPASIPADLQRRLRASLAPSRGNDRARALELRRVLDDARSRVSGRMKL